MSEELKPCPICGGAVKLHNSDDSYKMRVECTQCHCHLDSWGANDTQVGERWNDYELPVKRAPAVKSCPICGTAAQHGYIDGKHYVSCDNTACWFQTPLVDTQQEAANIWNGEVKMAEKIKLATCPICGGATNLSDSSCGYAFIECTECHAHTQIISYKEDLVKTWNEGNREAYKLKPLRFCPVCGSSAAHYKTERGHQIACINEDYCGFITPPFSSYDEAADFWNGDLKSEEILKPCPACGGRVELDQVADYYLIRCTNCQMKTENSYDKEELLNYWKDRSEKRLPALKPCPICGGAPELLYTTHGTWTVYCPEPQYENCCGWETPEFATPEEAANLWNGTEDSEDA